MFLLPIWASTFRRVTLDTTRLTTTTPEARRNSPGGWLVSKTCSSLLDNICLGMAVSFFVPSTGNNVCSRIQVSDVDEVLWRMRAYTVRPNSSSSSLTYSLSLSMSVSCPLLSESLSDSSSSLGVVLSLALAAAGLGSIPLALLQLTHRQDGVQYSADFLHLHRCVAHPVLQLHPEVSALIMSATAVIDSSVSQTTCKLA